MHAIWDALRRLITPPLDGEDEPSPPRAHAVRALEPHNPPAGASRPHKRRHTAARDEPSSREFRRPVDLDERLPVLLVSDDADAPCAPTPCASPLAARPPPRSTCAPPPSLIPITPPAAHIDLPRWRALPPPPAHAAARAFSRPDAYIVRSRSTRAPAELAAADSEASAAAPRARPGAGWAELMDALETSLDQPAHRSAAAKVSDQRAARARLPAPAPCQACPAVFCQCARAGCNEDHIGAGTTVGLRPVTGYNKIYALSKRAPRSGWLVQGKGGWMPHAAGIGRSRPLRARAPPPRAPARRSGARALEARVARLPAALARHAARAPAGGAGRGSREAICRQAARPAGRQGREGRLDDHASAQAARCRLTAECHVRALCDLDTCNTCDAAARLQTHFQYDSCHQLRPRATRARHTPTLNPRTPDSSKNVKCAMLPRRLFLKVQSVEICSSKSARGVRTLKELGLTRAALLRCPPSSARRPNSPACAITCSLWPLVL